MSGSTNIFVGPKTTKVFNSGSPKFTSVVSRRTSVRQTAAGARGEDAYGDLVFSASASWGSGEVSPGYPIAHPFTVDLAACYGYCIHPGDDIASVFAIFNKAVQIGTATFGIGQWEPVFAINPLLIPAKSFLYAVAPILVSASLQGAAFTIASA